MPKTRAKGTTTNHASCRRVIAFSFLGSKQTFAANQLGARVKTGREANSGIIHHRTISLNSIESPHFLDVFDIDHRRRNLLVQIRELQVRRTGGLERHLSAVRGEFFRQELPQTLGGNYRARSCPCVR